MIQQHEGMPGRPPADDSAVTLPWLLATLLRGRRLIIGVTLAGMAYAVTTALLKKPAYTSEFSFIPSSGNDQARSSLASLAGQFGINVGALGGQTQPPQLYEDLLRTRTVLATVARDSVTDLEGRRIPVSRFLRVRGADSAEVEESTIRALRLKVVSSSVAARTTGAVTVRARTGSPRASLEIANKLLEGLNQFNRVTRQSQATEERRFAEARLDSARRALRSIDDSLQQFLQGNRQFSSASRLRFEQERLESEQALQRDLVRGLSQQAEEARLREVRDMPVVTMIERPSLPVLRDPMGRVRSLFVATVLSFFLGVVIVLARAGWNRDRERAGGDSSHDQLRDEWRRMRLFGRAGGERVAP
jgi:uncharacterized protein involved in exopolysaccharide biosynthesis